MTSVNVPTAPIQIGPADLALIASTGGGYQRIPPEMVKKSWIQSGNPSMDEKNHLF
jgi:hypothetical protein